MANSLETHPLALSGVPCAREYRLKASSWPALIFARMIVPYISTSSALRRRCLVLPMVTPPTPTLPRKRERGKRRNGRRRACREQRSLREHGDAGSLDQQRARPSARNRRADPPG